MGIFLSVLALVTAGYMFGSLGFFVTGLLIGAITVVRKSKKTGKTDPTEIQQMNQSQAEIDNLKVEAAGATTEVKVKTKELSAQEPTAVSEVTTALDIEESWKKFESGVNASQQRPASNNDPEDKKPALDSEVRHKQWIPSAIVAAGVVGFLLFFHIVPTHLVIFPKQVPSFANTFVDIDDYLKQYNATNFIGQIALSQSYLHQQLMAKGLIVSTAKN